MNKARLLKITADLEQARKQAANLKTADLERLALQLGRTKRPGGSGHLVFKSPGHGGRTLTIPNHPSKAIGKGLALKIIRDLEGDVDTWEQYLDPEEG